jgi:hypothetical protein
LLKDWILFGLVLDPYRCAQCLRRFFRFRYRWVARAATVVAFLLPVLLLTAWFLELRALQKVRAVSTQEQPKPQTVTPVNIQQLLDRR